MTTTEMESSPDFRGWNYCFICCSVISTDKQLIDCSLVNKTSDKLILKYLLGKLDGGRALYEDVLQFGLRDEKSGGTRVGVQFCGWCQSVGESIMELQLQLDAIQMKIVDKLKTVRQAVISNSRLYGCNAGVKEELGRFEVWLEEQEGRGRDCKSERSYLEALHQFQTLMFEKDEQQWNIPLVMLEKCVGAEVIRNQERMTWSEDDNKNFTKDMVKEEPLEGLYDDFDMVPDYADQLKEKKRDKENDSEDGVAVQESKKGDEDETEGSDSDYQPEEENKKSLISKAKVNRSGTRTQKRRKYNKRTIKEEDSSKPVNNLLKLAKMIMPELKKSPKGFTKITYKTLGQRLALTLVRQHLNQCDGNPTSITAICEQCSFQPQLSSNMELHLLQHETDKKAHECPDCKTRFTQDQLFTLHLIRHSVLINCDLCKKSMDFMEVKKHLETDHPNETIFSCESCPSYFGYYPNFINHARYHRSDGKANVKCLLCPDNTSSKPFTYLGHLLKHLYKCHGFNELLIKCDDPNCTSVFFDIPAKQAHMPIHSEKNLCKVCNKSFISSSTLKDHIRTAHTKENKYKCELCPESFPWPCSLASHKIVEHNFPKYKCELCPDKQFIHRAGLIAHNKNKHPKEGPFKCDKCSKEFPSRDRLQRHSVVHKETLDVTCEICGFATKSTTLLQIHKKKHFDKRHECSYCGKKFAMKQYLDSHVRTHTKEKPFQCDLCGASFSQKGGLNAHTNKHHQQIINQ